MIKAKMIALTIILIISLFSGLCWGETNNFEINVGSEDVEVKANTQVLIANTFISVGAGALYRDDNFLLFNINGMLYGSVFRPSLTFGLGLKGLFGKAEIDNADYSLGALGFVVTGEYDFREDFSRMPITAYAGITFAPDRISFGDSTRYREINLVIRVYIIENAAIVGGYRDIEIGFESGLYEIEKSDNAFYLGVRFEF